MRHRVEHLAVVDRRRLPHVVFLLSRTSDVSEVKHDEARLGNRLGVEEGSVC